MEPSNGNVFVSYVRSDADFALQLARDMKAAGVAAWIDQIDIPPGDRWDTAIEKALRLSDCVVVVLSRASVESANVLDEVSFALDERKRVVPVLMEKCPVPMRLRRLQFIDFSVRREPALERLLAALSGSRVSTIGEQLPSTAGVDSPVRHTAASEPEQGRPSNTGLPVPTATETAGAGVLRPLYIGALAVAIVGAIGIYVVFESRVSESAMVTLSYFWVPLLAFGISGLSLTKESLGQSLAVAALSLALLTVFFSAIFPSL
jgi:hypothetical protein